MRNSINSSKTTHAQNIKMAARNMTLGAAPKPEHLLRPHWDELNERVWANHVTNKLYERGIISKRHKDEIEEKASISRREGAALLLDVMLTTSWRQCVEFAFVISQMGSLVEAYHTL